VGVPTQRNKKNETHASSKLNEKQKVQVSDTTKVEVKIKS
jgi:hypothetical protein